MPEGESGSPGPTGGAIVISAAIKAITSAGEQTLTFGRGIIDREEGFILRDIDESLSEAEQAALFVDTRPVAAKDVLLANVEALYEELEEALDFRLGQSFPLPDLLETLSDLLLNPTYTPGEPCLAPAPLLRDLLDMALGKVAGGVGALIGKVGQSVWDFLLPAGVEGEGLTHFIESILADPVTAALNLILGQRSKIDCGVIGELGVGQRVFETVIERLEGALTEALA